MAALIRVERIPGAIGSEIRNDSASRSGDIIMTLPDGCQVNDRYLVGLPHCFNNGIEFQVGINVGPLIWYQVVMRISCAEVSFCNVVTRVVSAC